MALSSYCHGYLRKKLRIKSLNCGPHKKPIYFAAPFRSCSKRNLVKENGLRVSINFRYWHIFGEPRLTIFFFFPLFSSRIPFFRNRMCFIIVRSEAFLFFIQMQMKMLSQLFFYLSRSNEGFYWICNFFRDAFYFSSCFFFFRRLQKIGERKRELKFLSEE